MIYKIYSNFKDLAKNTINLRENQNSNNHHKYFKKKKKYKKKCLFKIN